MHCANCKTDFTVSSVSQEPINFCPFCSYPLVKPADCDEPIDDHLTREASVAYYAGFDDYMLY